MDEQQNIQIEPTPLQQPPSHKKLIIGIVAVIVIVVGIGYFPFSSTRENELASKLSLPGNPGNPGKAGKLTLEGIDSDGDGVRDDVQRFIALNYSDSEKTRAALTQYAREQLQALLDAESKEVSYNHALEIGLAIECLFYIHGENAPDIRKKVKAEILNTSTRTEAFLTYDFQLNGRIFPSTPVHLRKTSCAFDPDSMNN